MRGCAAPRSTATNAVSSATPPTSRASVAGAVKPQSCMFSRASTTDTRPPTSRTSPRTSSGSDTALRVSGNERTPTVRIAAITGTFIRKIQRHPASTTMPPPSSGPRARNTVAPVDTTPIAQPLRSSGMSAVAFAYPSGISSAPPAPWSARAAISSSSFGAAAHATEPAPNTAAPIRNS